MRRLTAVSLALLLAASGCSYQGRMRTYTHTVYGAPPITRPTAEPPFASGGAAFAGACGSQAPLCECDPKTCKCNKKKDADKCCPSCNCVPTPGAR